MRLSLLRVGTVLVALCATGTRLAAQVFASEFAADPVSEGWTLSIQYCEPKTWNNGGWYHQELDLNACPPGPGGGRDSYRRSLQPFNGTADFFIEFRVQSDGDGSEIPGGAPALLVLGNNAGINYHLTFAQDVLQFFGNLDVPIILEIAPGVPHTYRLDLSRTGYALYVDGSLRNKGGAQGPFPAHDSFVSWRGRSWYLPCHNAWDYIRYGVIPAGASGDYDSDEGVGLFDYYFVHDCLTKDGPGIFGGPEESAGPGCRFTDFDADADTDLLDFAEFSNQFTGESP